MTTKLTVKQVRALHVLAYPQSGSAIAFWHDARASWQGPRRTLGSLERRGLAHYGHPEGPSPGWRITAAGREALEGASELVRLAARQAP